MSDTDAQTTLQTVAFAREAMIPPSPPPAAQRGVVRWLREGLLSGPVNILLTLAALWVLWLVLRDFLPWAWRGVWVAENLDECRAIRDARYGEGASAACWAVITDRWRQLTFGFYPFSELWRPPAALLLFLAAILPILFSDIPRRWLWGTAVAPFVIYWLLFGGPVWGPLLTGLGLGLVVLAAVVVGRQAGALWGAVAAALLFLVLFLGPLPIPGLPLVPPVAEWLAGVAPLGLVPVDTDDFGGFTLSITIGLAAIALSLPLGVLLALGRRSDLLLISAVSTAYIEIIRGVPLIVWLFTAQLLLNYFLPPGTNFDLMLRVIIMSTLFAAAYIAEVVRGGLASLPKGQAEGADSLGLDYWQSMRLVILPQALKVSIPGIVNTFIGLFKDTTLVAFIGMYDPIGHAQAIRADTDWQGIYWEIYVFIALVFFVFCFAMSRYSIWLERRLERSHR